MTDITQEVLKRTPLYETHVKAGARMVPFAGWEMPVQYQGVIPEHRTVRNAVGLFDVSHMGEIVVEGKDAFKLLDYLTCNNLARLQPGRAQYSAFTTSSGGVVDDIIIYMYSRERYFVCVNASNSDRDFEWLTRHNNYDAHVENVSSSYGQIAIQGPKAAQVLARMPGFSEIDKMGTFTFRDLETDWGQIIAARTGYTGEDGFELFIPADNTPLLWSALLECGATDQIQPIGLGARDTLRLEACLPLHGHELSEEVSAIESGLSWIVKPEKGVFLGREVLAAQQAHGAPRSLIGFFLDEAGIAREQNQLLSLDGQSIGFVTSGTRTPTLDRALGLALVESSFAVRDTKLQIVVRGKNLAAHVVARPFYKRERIKI